MRYEEYYQEELEKYKKKIAFLKKLPFIIITVLILIGGYLILYFRSGTIYQTEIASYCYGQQLESVPKSFLATSYFEFKYGEEWSQEVPSIPGEYTYRVKSRSLLGRTTYSDEYTYVVEKRSLIVICNVLSVDYGSEPTATADTINGDRLVDYSFIYDSMVLASTKVSVDTSSVRVEDVNGNDVTSYYNVKTKKTDIKFKQVPLTILLDDASKTYDGEALTSNSYHLDLDSMDTLVAGDTISFTTLGSQLYAGDSINEVDPESVVIKNADGDVVQNYRVDIVPGKLTVKPLEIRVRTFDDECTYDGDVHSFSSYTVNKSIPDELTVTPVECVDANNYPYDVNPRFIDKEVANSYIIKKDIGTITVNKKKATATILDMGDVVYSGTSIYKNVPIEYDSSELLGAILAVDAESSVSIISSGTKALGLLKEKTYTVMKDGKNLAGNFDITFKAGLITLIQKELELTPVMTDQEYTGTVISKSNTDNTNKDLVSGDSISYTCKTATKTIGEQEVSITDYSIVKGKTDVTNCYKVTLNLGQTNITKRNITYTIADCSGVYGDTVEFDYRISKGSLLAGHESEVTYIVDNVSMPSTTLYLNKVMNLAIDAKVVITNPKTLDIVNDYYNITITAGVLDAGKRNITIIAPNKTKEYDGTALGVLDTDWEIKSGSLLAGDDISFTPPTITQTVVGTTKILLTVDDFEITNGVDPNVKDYYNFTFEEGALNVTKRRLVVISDSMIKEYDFTSLSCDTFTQYGLLEGLGHKITVEINSELKVVGHIANRISSVTIYDGGNNDVTSYYSIVTYEGTLTYTERSA